MSAEPARESDAEPEGPRAPWEVEYLDVDGCRIAYVEQGGGEPIVFLHGVGASLSYFKRNVPHFGQSMRAIALDTPGFGASGVPNVVYNVPWMAGQIAGFLEAKGVGPATIVGNSMGGGCSAWRWRCCTRSGSGAWCWSTRRASPTTHVACC